MKKFALYLLGLFLAGALSAIPTVASRAGRLWGYILGGAAVLLCYVLLEGVGSSVFGARAGERDPFSFSAKSALLALVLAIPFFAVSFLVRYFLTG